MTPDHHPIPWRGASPGQTNMFHCLSRGGFATFEEAAGVDVARLSFISNFGRTSYERYLEALAVLGIDHEREPWQDTAKEGTP